MRAHNSSPKHAGFWAMTVALVAVAFSGCVGAEATSNLYVKDDLTDEVSAVHVTFTKAQVKAADGGWTDVYEGKQTIELLSLSGPDAKELLASFVLAPGHYERLRVVVSEVEVTHFDGTTQMLNVFGNIVSIAHNFTVGSDGIDILVDFDLEEGVDLEAGTYTPVVGRIETSDDEDGGSDRPPQHHGNLTGICAAERDYELAEAQADLDRELAEAQADLDRELAEAQADLDRENAKATADRDRKLAEATSSEESAKAWADYNETVAIAQADFDRDTAGARADYDEAVAEARADYDEAVSEIHADYDECLTDDDDDDEDDDDSDDDDDEE